MLDHTKDEFVTGESIIEIQIRSRMTAVRNDSSIEHFWCLQQQICPEIVFVSAKIDMAQLIFHTLQGVGETEASLLLAYTTITVTC